MTSVLSRKSVGPCAVALCSYVSNLPWYHCSKCFVIWEEDPSSFPTEAEIQEKERQDVGGRHGEDCYLGMHCQWCALAGHI